VAFRGRIEAWGDALIFLDGEVDCDLERDDGFGAAGRAALFFCQNAARRVRFSTSDLQLGDGVLERGLIGEYVSVKATMGRVGKRPARRRGTMCAENSS